MRILFVLAVSILLLASPAKAASPPTVVSASAMQVRLNPGVPSIPIGTGVVLQAGDPGDGSRYVGLPVSADSKIHCIVYRFAATDAGSTPCLRPTGGPVQVLMGASGAPLNSLVRISGPTGTWEVAPSGSASAYMQIWDTACMANSLCWAMPIGAYSVP